MYIVAYFSDFQAMWHKSTIKFVQKTLLVCNSSWSFKGSKNPGLVESPDVMLIYNYVFDVFLECTKGLKHWWLSK